MSVKNIYIRSNAPESAAEMCIYGKYNDCLLYTENSALVIIEMETLNCIVQIYIGVLMNVAAHPKQ